MHDLTTRVRLDEKIGVGLKSMFRNVPAVFKKYAWPFGHAYKLDLSTCMVTLSSCLNYSTVFK